MENTECRYAIMKNPFEQRSSTQFNQETGDLWKPVFIESEVQRNI